MLEVINLFLQALDEGFITDSHGIKVNLSNTIIIMTSNIGYQKEKIGFDKNNENNEEIRKVLSTSIVNRINTICHFKDLNKEDLNKILRNEIYNLRNKYKKHKITFHINNMLIDNIINKCDFEKYGCRQGIKLLENKIDDLVIDGILRGESNINIEN